MRLFGGIGRIWQTISVGIKCDKTYQAQTKAMIQCSLVGYLKIDPRTKRCIAADLFTFMDEFRRYRSSCHGGQWLQKMDTNRKDESYSHAGALENQYCTTYCEEGMKKEYMFGKDISVFRATLVVSRYVSVSSS
jgi:hypothetical protein